MKKLLAIALVLVMCLALVACGGEDTVKGKCDACGDEADLHTVEFNGDKYKVCKDCKKEIDGGFEGNYDDDDSDVDHSQGNVVAIPNTTSAVKEWVDENGDELCAALEQSFASTSGLTCTSDISVVGNGFIIAILINELSDVPAETRQQMQEAYDAMDAQFEAMLQGAQADVPELEFININVCDKNGYVLATIVTGD